jgi:hypothetical protein
MVRELLVTTVFIGFRVAEDEHHVLDAWVFALILITFTLLALAWLVTLCCLLTTLLAEAYPPIVDI